jgi:hypothetical protein
MPPTLLVQSIKATHTHTHTFCKVVVLGGQMGQA